MPKKHTPLRAALLLSATLALTVDAASAAAPSDPPHRQAWFGDLHLHTSFSFDAWSLMGTKTTPDEAYRFARGQTVDFMGKKVRRAEPLDFMAVTDHSEYMGVLRQLDDPNSDFSKTKDGQEIRKDHMKGFMFVYHLLAGKNQVPQYDGIAAARRDAWQKEVEAANTNYQPGKFTTFIAYEWTSMPQGRYNLHRNVIFSGDHAPLPFTSDDSQRPEDLWTYEESVRRQGLDVIDIPHNANASGGLMFDWVNSDGRPIDQAYAQRRVSNEPLTEIYQSKGSSETIPEISAADEFSNFEVMDKLLIGSVPSDPNGSYVRQAEGRGLILQQKVGVNPYKLGFVGATDFHNGLSTSAENAYAGGAFGLDPDVNLPEGDAAKRALTPQPQLFKLDPDAAFTAAPGGHPRPTPVIRSMPFHPTKTTDPTIFGSGGLTGVWAEENSRPSIFAALRRKESFATSGPRLRIRFFGGWNYASDLAQHSDWVQTAYAQGVPMGGDLPAQGGPHTAPRFVVWAAKDPNGANLDRIQVIKVWTEGNNYREKVFDVALSGGRKVDSATGHAPPVGDTVDLKTATYANTIGASNLAAVWQDPEFDGSKPAVYYARALEIPTPRWTTLLAVKRHLPLPDNGHATLQERAWASPIWYTPK
jgi:hypothetical protein